MSTTDRILPIDATDFRPAFNTSTAYAVWTCDDDPTASVMVTVDLDEIATIGLRSTPIELHIWLRDLYDRAERAVFIAAHGCTP